MCSVRALGTKSGNRTHYTTYSVSYCVGSVESPSTHIHGEKLLHGTKGFVQASMYRCLWKIWLHAVRDAFFISSNLVVLKLHRPRNKVAPNGSEYYIYAHTVCVYVGGGGGDIYHKSVTSGSEDEGEVPPLPRQLLEANESCVHSNCGACRECK